MAKRLKAVLVGDAMIPVEGFADATDKHLADYVGEKVTANWEDNWDKLQERRLAVEKQGPEIEEVTPVIREAGQDADILAGLFVPVSKKAMDCMPNLRIAGVARAGLENVNVAEATKKGVLVFNIQGRNAQAVSDFAVAMMLAESRNIARAHYAIKSGKWRKTFSNSSWIPEMKGKTVGIVGFGYIGRLVAQKVSGFDVRVLVFDPFAPESAIREAGCTPVDKETLCRESDYITLHARLSAESKNLIGAKEFALMKPTAYFINTARAGLVDEKALLTALKEHKIAGAGLDVFNDEPLADNSEFLTLDNVTLTSHLAGTTKEALSRSPELLMEDIASFLNTGKARFIVNPEVIKAPGFAAWLQSVKK